MPSTDHFTFYGDLLGIASAYQLGPNVAYRKLDTFYNTVFGRFESFCGSGPDSVHVQMFSDSVVAWGKGISRILTELNHAYRDLFAKGLLLRGAIVDGALQTEPRIEANGFRKFLPTNDTLARAVGLEKTVKGARLLIAPAVVRSLLQDNTEWLTVEGYLDHPYPLVPITSVLRRICPTPEGACHEMLYFWSEPATSHETQIEVKDIAERLKHLAEFHNTDVARHLNETLKLLRRCELRRRQTERKLSAIRIRNSGVQS